MKKFEIIATVGTNGMGTIIHENFEGNEKDLNSKLKELRKEWGGFVSCKIYEDGLKTFDSNWR